MTKKQQYSSSCVCLQPVYGKRCEALQLAQRKSRGWCCQATTALQVLGYDSWTVHACSWKRSQHVWQPILGKGQHLKETSMLQPTLPARLLCLSYSSAGTMAGPSARPAQSSIEVQQLPVLACLVYCHVAESCISCYISSGSNTGVCPARQSMVCLIAVTGPTTQQHRGAACDPICAKFLICWPDAGGCLPNVL